MPPIVNNGILDFGLRGALFGASIGGVVGLTKGFFGERRKMAMNGALQRHLRQYEFIKYDPELLTSIVEIGGKYRKFNAKAFSKIANGCNRLVSVNAQLMSGRLPAKPSTPRLILTALSSLGTRNIRRVGQRHPDRLQQLPAQRVHARADPAVSGVARVRDREASCAWRGCDLFRMHARRGAAPRSCTAGSPCAPPPAAARAA